jgi:hypothetical protein
MKRGAVLPPESPPPLAWLDTLVAEMERRIGLQVQALRGGGTDAALKNLVITDAEVDALLVREHLQMDEQVQPGSLFGQVLLAGGGSAARVLALQRRFELLPFEVDVLLACLLIDIDRRFERLYAYLNDDLSRPRPSADVLLRLLAPRGRRVVLQASLAADARLQRCGLLASEDAGRGTQAELFRVADGVARWLLEREGNDALITRSRLDEDIPPLAPLLWARGGREAAVAALLAQRAPGAPALIANIHGRGGSGRRFVVEAACARRALACVALDGRRLRRAAADFEATLTAALRDSLLLGGVVFLHHADVCLEEPERQAEMRAVLQPWLRDFAGTVLLGSEAPLPLGQWFPAADVADIELPPPDIAEREAAWTQALAAVSPLREPARTELARTLAAKFRMTLGELAMAAQQARTACQGDDVAAWSRTLHAVVSRVTAPRLHQLAEAMPAAHVLDDLVLPPEKLDVLCDLVRRVKHRRTVLGDWRFDAVSTRGRGLVALFHGASGTGKTMAADAIANTLRMQLFRIDLAGVVSKYIGETEKNLRAIFDEADRADAVLFFDEADALFGKRSEVKDAHDRYANIEINYLLQRIELFEGIAILATNKRGHLDDAFLRRIHLTLEFPLPRAAERMRLWDRSFPQAAPVDGAIDWDFLAQRFELTGGAIRNAALGAAYLAAEAEHEIGMSEVVNALRTELVKVGRRVPDSEFAPHTHLLAQPVPAAAAYTPRARTAAPTEI